jgi:uncharacterized integral membrane protein (TIGR00698 family)
VNAQQVFFLGLILASSGLVSPPLALLGGIAYGLTVVHPFRTDTHRLAKVLLQLSVVGLGFDMNLHEVARTGRSGFTYTLVSIVSAMGLGLLLGRVLNVQPKASFLIACGTAICGGSAIAAIAPIIDAQDQDMAISLGTVFTLNAAALLLFPSIGHGFSLSQREFGLWAALAIHDTSSVVGATAKYGPQALTIGMTVKLVRALWIAPLALVTALITKSKAKVQFPWFILFFILAAFANTYLSALAPAYRVLNQLGRNGLVVTLFLIGTGLSRQLLRQVGLRPMIQGVLLWLAVATLSLLAIRAGRASI